MNSRILALLIIFPIWLTLVIVFRKHRQWLFYYLIAAFGFSLQVVLLAEYLGFDQVLVNLASYHVYLLTKAFTHIGIDLLSNGRFEILLPDGTNSILKLGIECSALLETSIIVSLIVFYPLFNTTQKVIRALFGLVVTYVINLMRLMIIVLMAYKFGPDYIFLAHAGVARIFFFIAELILYWYIITKPTVKSVGDSISKCVGVTQTATVDRSLRFRNSLGQIFVILLVINLTIMSFVSSNEWRKSFKNFQPAERPIIYQDETGVESQSKPQTKKTTTQEVAGVDTAKEEACSIINQEMSWGLDANEKTSKTFVAKEDQDLNIQVLEGQGEIAARLLVNDDQVDFLTAPSWVYLKEASLFDTFSVKSGDSIEIRFQNISDSSAHYKVKIYSPDASEVNCTQDKSQPTSIAAPSPSVEGAGTTKLGTNQEGTFTMASHAKSSFEINATLEQKLNIYVTNDNQPFLCELILNGKVYTQINSSQRPDNLSSYNLPILVSPGDRLEIKLENLSSNPSTFSFGVSPLGGTNE